MTPARMSSPAAPIAARPCRGSAPFHGADSGLRRRPAPARDPAGRVLPTGRRGVRPTIPHVRSPRTRRDSACARRWRSVGWSWILTDARFGPFCYDRSFGVAGSGATGTTARWRSAGDAARWKGWAACGGTPHRAETARRRRRGLLRQAVGADSHGTRNSVNIAVIGAQWGDEGKGKVVDLLTPNVSIVARYQGGHNAGHTVRVGRAEFILHLLPSGILHPGVRCVIGNGVVIDPVALFSEIEDARRTGRRGRRPAAHQRPGARHSAVSPRPRSAVRGAPRRSADRHDLARHRADLRGQGRTPRHPGRRPRRCVGRRVPGLGDSGERVGAQRGVGGGRRPTGGRCTRRCARRGGAWRAGWATRRSSSRGRSRPVSGCFLRAPRGPCSTSTTARIRSSPRPTRPSAGSAPVSGSVPALSAPSSASPRPTRPGSARGPLPTELHGAEGDLLRESGREYGASTGRPRRCGWYDAVAVRYAVRVNGLDALAVTKLDVLDGLDEIPLCTAYRHGGGPADGVSREPRDPRRLPAGVRAPARVVSADRRRASVRRPAAGGPGLPGADRGPERGAGRHHLDRLGSGRHHSRARRTRRPVGRPDARGRSRSPRPPAFNAGSS